METDVSFGLWLEKRRKALDLTREELALKSGCSTSALRKIESDERRPSKQLAELLANALEIPTDERPTFIRIARGEFSIERLKTLPLPPPPHLFQSPRTFSKLIPIPPTPLIGRETELAALRQMLSDSQCRLVTLVGPGGSGKTRLAMEIAREHGDNIIFVPLASVDATSQIVQAITDELGFVHYGSADPIMQLLNYLRQKNILLVLDNMEHLLDGADLIAEILQSAPDIKILCTSREPFHLRGEWVFEVGGLNFQTRGEFERAESYSANDLFTQCAQRTKAGFVLTAEDELEVTRICTLVEGMPLAIELAAAWVRTLSCHEIAQEIERGLDILVSSTRDMPERHHSMRAVFDHSWNLLSDEERRALASLSVFRGGFTREAVLEIAGVALAVLSSLVSKSIVRFTETRRYDLHELLRQYAMARLEADPIAAAAIRQRHYDYYLALAQNAGLLLKGSNQLEWLSCLEQEHDNLRAAMRWSLINPSGESALKLSVALSWFWYIRAYYREGCDWLMKALDHDKMERNTLRARALEGIALLNRRLGNHREALSMAEESASIFRNLGDKLGLAGAFTVMGLSLEALGDMQLAQARFSEALTLYRELGDPWGIARGLANLGSYELAVGNQMVGRSMVEESVEILSELGDRFILGNPLIQLGELAYVSGDYVSSRNYFERSLYALRQIRDPEGIANALTSLSQVLRAQGEYTAARVSLEEAMALYRTWGHDNEIVTYCGLVENDIAEGDLPAARLYLAEAANLTRATENIWVKARMQFSQGMLAYYEGDIGHAEEILEENVAILRTLQEKAGLAMLLVALGKVLRDQGKTARAEASLTEGIDLFHHAGNKLGIATALEALAGLAISENPGRAALLFGSADAIRSDIGAPLPQIDRQDYERDIASICIDLGETAFSEAWEKGYSMNWEQAIAVALDDDRAMSDSV